jgi:hypothetical protein
MISEDPVLRNTKLIAEAWDCDGLNQVRCPPLQTPSPPLVNNRIFTNYCPQLLSTNYILNWYFNWAPKIKNNEMP